MGSALQALVNSTVTFSVPSVGVTTEAETGNVVPVQGTLEVDCYLKAVDVRSTALPGVDTGATVYEGYALEALGVGVVKGSKALLVFAGQPAVECEVVGVREPYGSTGLLGSVLGQALGERIRLVTREQV